MDKLTREVLLASQSMLTQEELDMLLRERRAQERTEHWTALERFVRVPLLKLRGRV